MLRRRSSSPSRGGRSNTRTRINHRNTMTPDTTQVAYESDELRPYALLWRALEIRRARIGDGVSSEAEGRTWKVALTHSLLGKAVLTVWHRRM